MEQLLERLIYASRWIIAPIYLGLSLVLLLLGIKFFEEILILFPYILSIKEGDLILKVLTLIDITLVCGLVVMVMFSGYENFVSKLDINDESKKLNWLGTMDANSLKTKVAASIVAISSIHLLKLFMEKNEEISTEKLLTYMAMHLTFVVSAFAMGYLDKITRKEKKEQV